ncbi:hypothetical protein [Moritella sp. F3]|uniref:hypothetical protein n=1 Tax=Moritella sp. F3 TaxID=2718882 RepID=UPI0018E117E6|nr:hypothetical protein [Moritella sp. F3]GIC77298.1 hypothetical protein FMO001_20250 [Moritella sp. F1]GIC83174.1 hypothetical protein FMO003_34540 [Moritella sp. F3]
MMNTLLLNTLPKKRAHRICKGICITAFAVTVAAVVTGCSSVDVLTKTENGASFEYQIGQFQTIEVVDMAKEHCGKYGKLAELTNRYSDAHRVFNTLIFSCS